MTYQSYESEETHIKGQIQRDDVGSTQQFVKGAILGPATQFLAQPAAVVILNVHAERLCLFLQVPPDPSHAEDSEHFVLRIMTQRRSRIPSPIVLPQREHGGVVVP